ncbi:hypothetical protein FisN_8Hh141 [Fistulifera solaris]|jgi:hypothetical protein|uniref:RRM domain-containing protein n=1 Tax=Fistulifera solaris TaxID=1519565 RepID=A0A1Z5JY14_FISSO|nr:hypothetical protein FisN_8Hh141 [Fistulifera solaris]|eukprot:GAX18923.1 hypothetical protein FisN_8Hh141 [Fistulifera solaris]
MVEVERIYVGGVDPPRLTVEEVMHRMAADVKDKVELQDMCLSSIYCHFNAISLQPGVSALETIRKLYNNVKWKGCKLKVEAAKPHYLDRLAKERAERLAFTAEEETELPEPVPIPRHLKIRRGYGEESWKVDTKPCEVSDWSTFRKMRTRLIGKQAKTREKKNKTVNSSAWNRAVLLRFKETDDSFSRPLSHPASLDVSESDEENEVSDTDSSSTSSNSSSKENNVRESKSNGGYVWSDSSDDENDVGEKENPARQIEKRLHGRTKAQLEATSSEEESLSLKDEIHDDTSSVEEEQEKISADDVQSNLNILAQIFPDLEGKKPHSKVGQSETAIAKGSSDTRKGWTEMGQMVRFDPTQLSSEKFIVEPSVSGSATEDEEVEMKRDDDSREESVSSEEEAETDMNIGDMTGDVDASGMIYEQDKLEQVFKANREQESRELESILAGAPAQQSTFSFSFQVQESKPTVAQTIVDLPVARTEKKAPESILADPMQRETEEPKQKRRRRGVAFPDKDLDAYVNFFYSQGDGSRIRSQGIAAYREDPQVQVDWASQRRILTLDWRRKHKYAVAQKRKRFGR